MGDNDRVCTMPILMPGRESAKQHFRCRGAACQCISMSVCLDSNNLSCLACPDILWKQAAGRMVMSISAL